MQLTIEYREKPGSYANKDFFLICKVKFSNEELAVADERGMWGMSLTVPSGEPPPSTGFDFKTRAMRFLGICLIPIGLVSSCITKVADASGRTDAPPLWLGLGFAAIGATLMILAQFRDSDALKNLMHQDLTLRRLVTNGVFQIHAFSLEQAKQQETEVREKLKLMADSLRSSTVVPEQTTYDL